MQAIIFNISNTPHIVLPKTYGVLVEKESQIKGYSLSVSLDVSNQSRP